MNCAINGKGGKNMKFKGTGNYIYKYDVRDKINQKVKELKEQGYKKYYPNIYNNGSIWKNEKTGKYVDIRYGYGILIIEEVEEA